MFYFLFCVLGLVGSMGVGVVKISYAMYGLELFIIYILVVDD
jgi:hypothetical protein